MSGNVREWLYNTPQDQTRLTKGGGYLNNYSGVVNIEGFIYGKEIQYNHFDLFDYNSEFTEHFHNYLNKFVPDQSFAILPQGDLLIV